MRLKIPAFTIAVILVLVTGTVWADTAFSDAATIATGESLREVIGDDLDNMMGMAEYNYNVQRVLFLDPFGAHYLQVPTIEGHRFNRTFHHADFVVGGRDVETIVDLSNDSAEYSAGQIPFDTLYFSGIYGERDDDYKLVVEETHKFALDFN